MIRQHDGPWNTWLCQDLDGILEAWDSSSLSESTTGVLHLGFQPLETKVIEGIASDFEGDLLLTQSAKYGLPEAFTASTVPVGSASGMPLHRVEGGWGVQQTSAHHQASPPGYQRPEPNDTDSWLTKISAENHSLARALKRVGIHDDRTYYAREWCLKMELRRKLGVFRANELGVSESPDPCRMAKSAPPWLIDRSIDLVNFRVRPYNVFKAMKLQTIRDLAGLTRDQLLAMRNFGETSCKDVVDTIKAEIEAGPPELEAVLEELRWDLATNNEQDTAVAEPGLVASLWRAFQNLTARDAKVLALRLGFLARQETLQEIATSLGVTRERVRQMEVQALKRFLDDSDWLGKLDAKVDDLKRKLMAPLSLSHAQELDRWFDGVSEYSSVIERVLRKSKGSDTHIVEIDGTQYFSRVSQGEWDHISARIKNIVNQSNTGEVPREHSREIISDLLPESAQEFSEMLLLMIDK